MRLIAEKQIRPTVSAQLQEFRQQLTDWIKSATLSRKSSHRQKSMTLLPKSIQKRLDSCRNRSRMCEIHVGHGTRL